MRQKRMRPCAFVISIRGTKVLRRPVAPRPYYAIVHPSETPSWQPAFALPANACKLRHPRGRIQITDTLGDGCNVV
jgi:hypothetical protein